MFPASGSVAVKVPTTPPAALFSTTAGLRNTASGAWSLYANTTGSENTATGYATLYANSTLALNPDTGKLVWYFQHVPNDQWDFDWAFERQLLTLPINGRDREVLLTSGKEAIYDALELDGGKYAFSIDLGLQNFITDIDARTGAKTIDPKLVPSRGQVLDHIGLTYPNLDTHVPRLRREGVKILEDVHKWGDTRAAMIEGPDRIAIEIVEVK